MHDFFWRMGEGAQFRIALKIKGGSWLVGLPTHTYLTPRDPNVGAGLPAMAAVLSVFIA
ncbi:hypothetical protein [Pseudomonas sp. 910_23]|uniref:hypothetical protein n=1 Tax=Pseudomonas sp. 910_23 TaxID=2604461 RepID=UPI0040639B56